jgi:lipopolysaccharide export system protein LptA
MYHKLLLLMAIFFVINVLSRTALARYEDTKLPLHIESDTAELDDNTGISTYRGNVRITQGSMRLTGDVVTLIAPEKRIEKITAEGQPATFHQLTKKNEKIDAEALYMEYNTKTNKITLKRKAKLMQGGNSFTSERIEYNLVTKIMDAGEPESGDRVKMVIVPSTVEQ